MGSLDSDGHTWICGIRKRDSASPQPENRINRHDFRFDAQSRAMFEFLDFEQFL
jgi:hypothetical protein